MAKFKIPKMPKQQKVSGKKLTTVKQPKGANRPAGGYDHNMNDIVKIIKNDKSLSASQKAKLINKTQKRLASIEKTRISTKAQNIMATGGAVAESTAAPAMTGMQYVATKNGAVNNANTLVNGGSEPTSQNTTDSEEEDVEYYGDRR